MNITDVPHSDTVPARHHPADIGMDAIAIPPPADVEVKLATSMLMGAVLTGLTVAVLQPYRGTQWGKIVLERGATQYLSIFLTFCVLGFVSAKMIRIASASRRSQFDELPEVSHLSPIELVALRDRLARTGDALSLFRARALQAFMVSRKRSAAVTQLQEDTSLAHEHIEQAYAIPRVMIWAIPLMGFIGTVVGISSAVAGFTGFLQGAQEIEQVRGAIGNVTTGLAVAFDTTLVALVLSVIAMLAVSTTERLETRRLLAMEADVNQTILAGLPEGGDLDSLALRNEVTPLLDRHAAALEGSLRNVIRESLPRPEEMVLPAQAFLREAAGDIASSARASATEIAAAGRELHQFYKDVLSRLQAEQDHYAQIAARRDSESAEVLRQMATAVQHAAGEVLRELHGASQRQVSSLELSTASIGGRLERLSASLEQRLEELNEFSRRVSEATVLERSLQRTLNTLNETADLQGVLGGVRTSLDNLQPMMERLAQPRRILLVESENAQAHG